VEEGFSFQLAPTLGHDVAGVRGAEADLGKLVVAAGWLTTR
jgi:hypothetical protein